MPILTPTNVHKRHDIAPVVVSDSSLQYRDEILPERDLQTPNLISKLIDDITRLDKRSHSEIYKVLRRTKPKEFFSANAFDTRFNINALNNRERHDLYRTVQLCKEGQSRRRVKSSAISQHENTMKKVDQELGDINAPELEIETSRAPHPHSTEADKIKEMLRLNDM